MGTQSMPRELWRHPTPRSTSMWQFMETINRKHGLRLKTFEELYDYSIAETTFWSDAWEELSIIHIGSYNDVVDKSTRMDSVPQWFSGVRLNLAENILYTHAPGATESTMGKEDNKVAVTEVREGATELRHVTWGELRKGVGRLASAMRVRGIGRGDRVAAVASNCVDTLMVFLATTSLGALFTSSSTDMGVKGILDRLIQIQPTFLFMDNIAIYNGKQVDLRGKMKEIVQELGSADSFKGIVVQARVSNVLDLTGIPYSQTFEQFQSCWETENLRFAQMDFQDPVSIAFSSGTTGKPKCIMHSTGGMILSAKKEGHLHHGIGPNSVCLQYTTTGWAMYFSSILSLLHGARVILYDGSPFKPDLETFIQLVGDQGVTFLGISPRYMIELQRNDIVPREVTDLSALQVVTSTGMVLSDRLFEWFYDVGFPATAQLANCGGATDLGGFFALENPMTPMYVGGCQGPSLGIPIAVYDSTNPGGIGVVGSPLPHGEPGELVFPKPFPNMPVKFWGDNGSRLYFDAYFSRFDNVWVQGDFVTIHPKTRGLICLGRSDGVLNPSGVRFGSSEIYSILEAEFGDKLADSLCVGQRRPQDGDESVVLFLMMRPGHKLSPKLITDIKTSIRRGLSARHVPKYVFETPEIPITVNLKKVELPVRQIISGNFMKPSGTLLNPSSLEFYRQFVDIEKFVIHGSKL
ncbi:acetoacetyl-CoA synthase [Cadophora sp. MPI-SDFR-AT-0126]|nr:acetoacetyl-CoA synthase [Leptodontidium sp. MPI-SDFR-AT-0119]KAH7418871.1 acetoacetyl-CoA synthase [Leotiomycetes sp. MPI-SDFR-AT-0126]